MAYTICTDDSPADYPSAFLETGNSQSDTALMRVCHFWPHRTDGPLKVVLLCKIFTPHVDNKITAALSLRRMMPGPNKDIVRTILDLLPNPHITINELFGGATPDGLDPNTQLPFNIADLRALLARIILKDRVLVKDDM
ncbi:hypothetical protein B9Z19DRAFT_1120169 [Tuber borchii]|uniref:Uncharacterized protein n=1 Tax=Tuber borchii TaxID=42251 RepID=A0A2T7A4X6_TUBBO|nr:hypothetical protein B9Z19DRAFT_1120169 [Tuber borchii]